MNEGSTWTLTYVELFDLIMESPSMKLNEQRHKG